MEHILTVGYIGIEGVVKKGTTFTGKNPEEPTKTIDKIIKFLKLEKQKAKIELDFSLVYQGSPLKKREKEIKQIWKDIVHRKHTWKELKPKLLKLLELGEGLLPLVFDINYDDFQIQIVDGEDTILVISEDYDKLKELKTILEEESDIRVTPYGRVGSSKIELK